MCVSFFKLPSKSLHTLAGLLIPMESTIEVQEMRLEFYFKFILSAQ